MAGIGQFTIYDPATVCESDLGVNFFLDEDSLGKSRAQCCTEMLLELNPEVHGEWHPNSEVHVLLLAAICRSSRFDHVLTCSV